MKRIYSVLAAVTLAGFGTAASAAVFSVDNGNFHATATVTVEATDIKVVLTNNTTGTHSAADTLTAFSFNGINTLTILKQPGDTSAATLRTFTAALAFSDVAAGVGDVGWHISDPKGFGTSLNFSAPDQAIVSNNYDAAGVNSSLLGNHNPLILTTGTWYLSKGAFISDADITNVAFRFGTDLETLITPPGGGDTPEPASLAVLTIGAAALLTRRRKA